jgi:polyisoprenoid-binding protein YceI
MKILKQSALMFSFALMAAACNNGSDGTKAEVGEAQEVSLAQEAATYSIDTAESEVSWIGRKPGGEHTGTMAIENGHIQVKNEQIVGGLINIDLNRLEVLDLEGEYKDKLTGHLKSEDFFFTEQYPKAVFQITSVKPYEGEERLTQPGDDTSAMQTKDEDRFEVRNPTHNITGNLTMRDTTLSITIPARVEMGENQISANSKFVIDRTNWNLKYQDETNPVNIAKDKFIYNDVKIGFGIVATNENAVATRK